MPRENRKHVSARTANRSSRSRNKRSSSDERPVPAPAAGRAGVASVGAACFMDVGTFYGVYGDDVHTCTHYAFHVLITSMEAILIIASYAHGRDHRSTLEIVSLPILRELA